MTNPITMEKIEKLVRDNLADEFLENITNARVEANHVGKSQHVTVNLSHEYLLLIGKLMKDYFATPDDVSVRSTQEEATGVTTFSDELFSTFDQAVAEYIAETNKKLNEDAFINVKVNDGIVTLDVKPHPVFDKIIRHGRLY